MAAFRERLLQLEGLDKRCFQRLMVELDRVSDREGYDDQGRLRCAMFDAKPYDIESFERHNQGRFAIHPIQAALNNDTVPAAEGCKAVCIFVNDTCDAAIVERLAAQGVELLALKVRWFQQRRPAGLPATPVERRPRPRLFAVCRCGTHGGAMLMLNRRLHLAYQRNRAGYFVLDGLTGFDMRGKTVGIIGTGKIGRCAIDILLGFGCRILAFDKFPSDELAARQGVQYVDLD